MEGCWNSQGTWLVLLRGSETGKQKKPFTTERQRREHWNDKFTALRNLVIPNPTKLQRLSKDTEVDVRIIDDEVTIKLVRRKKNGCLFVSKILDELQLDLHRVAGGHIGDYCSFLFSTKADMDYSSLPNPSSPWNAF
ncbi:hypothetical protein Patl1_25296 [Pistacia atlantica]|uniref:Uncharacterized protein n=1 Tax=Pistacia atlantica TaxID=434234 RepID=A0ACC1B2G5_9ROSI|nr:hypothetical protein Patl1_25296 [Pistacia atlantica]